MKITEKQLRKLISESIAKTIKESYGANRESVLTVLTRALNQAAYDLACKYGEEGTPEWEDGWEEIQKIWSEYVQSGGAEMLSSNIASDSDEENSPGGMW